MASVVISSTVFPNVNYAGTTFTWRIFSDKSWVAQDGTIVPARGDQNTFYKEYTVSMSGTNGTVPAITLLSQTDAPSERNAKYSIYWYVDGVEKDMVLANSLGAFTIPDTPITTNWSDLEAYNFRTNHRYWQDDNTYSRLQINQLLATTVGTGAGTGTFCLYTSNYVSFNACLTAITALGGGTLVVDNSSPVTATVATTAQVAVRFQGQGLLTGSGKTVTIVGPIDAPVKQLWQSGITISFTGKYIVTDSAWWGVLGDDSNHDEVPLQAAIDATPNDSVLRISGGPSFIMRWYGTVTTHNRFGLKIVSVSGGGNHESQSARAKWYGATGGTMWSVDGCDAQLIDGFGLDARGLADFGLKIDQAGGSNTMTDSDFKNMLIEGGGSRATFEGVSIARTSSNNCEDLRFENVNVIASNADSTYQVGTASINTGTPNLTNSSISLTGKEGYLVTQFRAGPFTAFYGLNDLWSSVINSVGSASTATLNDNASNTVSNIAFSIIRPGTGWGFRIGGAGGGSNAFGITLKKCLVQHAAIGFEGQLTIEGGFSLRNLINFKGNVRVSHFRDESSRQLLVMPAGIPGPVELAYVSFGGDPTTPLGIALIDAANAKLTMRGCGSEAQPHNTIFTAGGPGSNSTLTAWDNGFGLIADSSYLNLTAFDRVLRWDGNGGISDISIGRSLLARMGIAGLSYNNVVKHLISLTPTNLADPMADDYGSSGSNGRVFIDQGGVGTQLGGPVVLKGTFQTPRTVSADTVLDSTYSIVFVDASGGAKTITLPLANDSSSVGLDFTIKKIDASANAVTVIVAGGQTIDTAANYGLATKNKYVRVVCPAIALVDWKVIGNN